MRRSAPLLLLLASLWLGGEVAAHQNDRPVPGNWPSFRGPNASGVAIGSNPPTTWGVEKGQNVRWKTPIPGLAHSCPIVWGEQVFVTTAVSSADEKPELKKGLYGDPAAARDMSKHTWRLLCLERTSGKLLWDRVAHAGVPRVKRHVKASHANATPATDGKHLVAILGSEGLFCFDLQGKLLWKKELGILDAGAFDAPQFQWGPASSPIVWNGLAIVQCDQHKDSYVAAFELATGKEAWRTSREELPSWSTPTVCESGDRPELITAAPNYTRAYDPKSGKELWRLGNHSKITTPTPIFAHGLIFVTDGYFRPGIKPIYAIRPGATGDISLKAGEKNNRSIAWSDRQGGPYTPTPIVVGDHFYVCSNRGVLTCYEARTGERIYQERLPNSNGFSASPVAAEGRLYFPDEDGDILVVRAGPRFELLARNEMGEACLATPALTRGLLIVRSQHHVWGLGEPGGQKK